MSDKKRDPVITDFAERGQTRLLLVEGKDDGAFLFHLLKHLGLDRDIFIYAVDGKSQFPRALRVLITSTEFSELDYLGIIRDRDFAEDDPNPFVRLLDALERANERHDIHNYPVPTEERQPASNEQLTVNILILPEAGLEGMLEDLIYKVFQDDAVTQCVNEYFTCLETNIGELRQNVLPKAKLRTFIAGKAVDAKYSDRDIWKAEYIYNRATWWQDDYWNNTAFDSIKTFLTQMVD